MIKNATNSGHPTHKELVSFGCTIPNCKNTIWTETKSEVYVTNIYDVLNYKISKSEVYQYFPNKVEVWIQIFKILYSWIVSLGSIFLGGNDRRTTSC